MTEPNPYAGAVEQLKKLADDAAMRGPPLGPPIDPPDDRGDNSGMNPSGAVEARLAKVETGIVALQHSQNLIMGMLGAGLALIFAILIYFAQSVSVQVGDMNVRFDRFLERQADAAFAANARFDRLLEQRASQSTAPIIIQVPSAPPLLPGSTQLTPPKPPG